MAKHAKLCMETLKCLGDKTTLISLVLDSTTSRRETSSEITRDYWYFKYNGR